MEEIWKDIPEYEGLYQASNLGRIRSIRRYGTAGGILKGEIDDDGYIRIPLSKNNIHRKFKAHRLVFMAFCPTGDPKLQINHKDGNKKNNKLENLEWCTASYNTIHSYINGLNKTRGIKVIVIDKKSNEKKEYKSYRAASLDIGRNKGYISGQISKNIYENEKYIWQK